MKISLKYKLENQQVVNFQRITSLYNQIKPILLDVIGNLDHNSIKLLYNKRVENLNFSSRFLPDSFTKKINSQYRYVSVYQIEYDTNKINFSYYTRDNRIDFLDFMIKIQKLSAFMRWLGIQNKTINIFYVNLPDKKILTRNSILGPINVNSGYSTIYHNDDTNIVVFREEESDKVLLHELIHSLKLDFSVKNQEGVDKLIGDEYKITKNINLSESFTDAWAILFNSICNSILTGENPNRYILEEINYQEKVVDRILGHYRLDKFGDSEFNQDTSVFSYYIIKLGLFKDLDNFIENYPIGNIEWDDNSIEKLYRIGNRYIKRLARSQKADLGKSLRMTHNDLKIDV